MKKFVLVKNYSSDFREPVWERRWQEPERDLSFALEELSGVRTCSGFGIRSPFAILVGRHSVCTKTLGTAQTLADDMMAVHYPADEKLARSIGEQVCFGLHRLHQGLGRSYGAVYPYNIGHDGRNRSYFIWSTPTAQLETANTPWNELDACWDLPYRAPEISENIEPGTAADIYGLGRIIYEMSPQSVQVQYEDLLKGQRSDVFESSRPTLAEIILATQWIEPQHRYSDAVSLAEALNPETRLRELDIQQGQVFLKKGVESFHRGEYEEAEELWQEARQKDWLGVAVWNNLAVCKMREQEWETANKDLKKALKLDPSHAVVRCNLAFCRFKLGQTDDAERYATETVAMRPDLVAGRIVLSNLAFRKGQREEALFQASEAVLWHPKSRSARWQHLRVLKETGYQDEATREREYLENLEYKVPFADFLIDDTTDPPWGRVRPDDSPPNLGHDLDDDGPNPDDTGSRVPLNPMPPRPGASAKISSKNYRRGIKE